MLSSLTTFQESVKCKVWKKWQLFHATDFQSLMYPCFTFCSVLGLFPYKINGSTFETSKQRYILPTVVLCVLCSYELIVLYEIDITQTIKFKGVPKTLERNCFYILGNFIAVVTYILSGPRMHLLQSIMNVSSNLPLNSYQQLSKLIHTKDVIGFVFLIGEMVFYYSTLDFDTWHKAFVPYLNFLIFQTDMLYMNCVCILKACFKRIDDNLINLRDHVVNDQPHLLRRNYHVKRNPLLLMELKALKKQHLAISDTVEMLNVIFSLQIIASVILTFAEITFQLYFYIMHWKIVWACETGKDQAIKIGTTIHELLNDVTDEQIKSELQLFSLQILHRENAFTAKGLIVDATLLTAIVGNITTYLLILIQFLIAANSCHGKLTHNITEINF
ncbi:PREDICTED: uncharacterized protein LOC105461099 isoform X2 [Wasmannia auropunctata]|uniref:uncharacterized protein LOC105461099 isoform X2 n=1 Tax=Wasmannia auropunctata TaxID=64793 RepID=UPI0005EF9045|nr:PREDICTED: uncharacterized protein LOC105461099 isoform X2 [Wasmannia auropunctata]